ncbi:MAG: hypothetical protein RL744_1740 [Pseudomonadota bacterium]|jgi:hypothetical protein
MKDEFLNEAKTKGSRTITICMDVFGVDRQIDVDFDYYFNFLGGAHKVIKSMGNEKARLIFNIMIGAISQKALHLGEGGWSDLSDYEIIDFDHDCYIATLMGNLLRLIQPCIKANWDFDAAIAQIDCPCCGEKLCSIGSN